MKFVHRTVQQQNKILLRQSFGADTAGGRLVFFQIWKNLNWNNHLNEEANNVKAKRENWNYAVEKIVGVFSWGNVARIPAFNVRMGHCKKKKKKKDKMVISSQACQWDNHRFLYLIQFWLFKNDSPYGYCKRKIKNFQLNLFILFPHLRLKKTPYGISRITESILLH